ncbi:M91 family zinc metallopeptidase [Alienimonas californiensis]|uniref:Uncharacterized protein n=1 Tax=Alienimonas californiensis TaxID=2527989 RepID=A0A517P4Y3_9PLAN|nr:M91 family zinc metallopeptidase [Alienimonas californiensis]QDT14421.1 hypothetical protein CA12_04940 [Alienimonas californiensis]
MRQHLYSTGVTINGQYRAQGAAVTLSNDPADDFINGTKACLNELKGTSTGARLLKEIDESGHVVTVYRTEDKLTGGNSQGGDSAAAGVDMVVALDSKRPDGSTELQEVLARATQDLSGRSKAKKFFGIGKARPKFLPLDAIARLVGASSNHLKEMAAGKRAIPPAVDAKLRVYLYDFLTPGTGQSCFVNFNHLRDNLSEAHKKYLPQGLTWMNRPPAVALGHELIHAWRVMSGRVLFKYGWEEEAMTVGLPPFVNMPLTENQIRVDWGNLAIRPHYEFIQMKTGLVSPKGAGIASGTNTWQGNDKALHANQRLARTAADRRQAMGYNNDTDDADEEWDD